MSSAPESANVWLVIRKAAYWIEQHALRSVTSTGLGLTDFAVLKVLLFTGPLPVNVIDFAVSSAVVTDCGLAVGAVFGE